MAHKTIQPSDLFDSAPFGFSQVVQAQAGTTLFLSGQGAFDREFNLVGGEDLGQQTTCALQNIASALAAAAASIGDLTSLRIYVVDYEPSKARAIGKALGEFFDAGPYPAQTLIGVQALGMPGMLIEIEATAVVAQ